MSSVLYDLELEFRELCLPQDICIMFIWNLRIMFIPKIFVLCIIQYLRIMFTPRLADLTIES